MSKHILNIVANNYSRKEIEGYLKGFKPTEFSTAKVYQYKKEEK